MQLEWDWKKTVAETVLELCILIGLLTLFSEWNFYKLEFQNSETGRAALPGQFVMILSMLVVVMNVAGDAARAKLKGSGVENMHVRVVFLVIVQIVVFGIFVFALERFEILDLVIDNIDTQWIYSTEGALFFAIVLYGVNWVGEFVVDERRLG